MITIFGLSKRVASDLRVMYNDRIFDDVTEIDPETFDVVLNRNTILKAIDDRVILDLGGTKSTIEMLDYHYVAIG